MRKNGVNKVNTRVYGSRRNVPYLNIKRIFEAEDKAVAKMRLNGYRSYCRQTNSLQGLKRADAIKELLDLL